MQMLKNGSISIIDLLLRIFNRCMKTGVASEDWKLACIVPVCKARDSRRECSNYGRISISRKIRGNVLNSIMMKSKDEYVVEEQREFRSGIGYVDQIVILQELVEKYREKR